MSFKKFLAATSVVALLAGGSAQALDLTGTTVTLATEVDYTTPARGVLDTTVTTTGTLPNANGYKLTATLTGDLQFRALTAGSILTGAGDINIAGSTISTGGADGSQTVVIIFNTISTGTTFDFNPQVQVVGPAGGSLTINLTDPTGNVIEGGVATLRDGLAVTPGSKVIPAIAIKNAFTLSVAADANDSFLDFGAVPAYSAFEVAGGDTSTTATLGDITLALATGVSRSSGTAFVPVTAADVASYKISTNMPSTTGVTSVSHPLTNGMGPVTATKAGTVYTATVAGPPTTAAAAGTLTGTVLLTAGPTIQTQSPTVTLLELNFGALTGLVAKEGGTINKIDILNLEGESEGPFKWVGDATLPTGNVFRVTGIKTAVPVIYVNIQNSTAGVDGVYVVPTSGKTLSGNATTGASELILTNADIQNAVGAPFGRADVTFTFANTSSATATINVDRLLATGPGIVSAFGDTNNN